MAANLCSEGLVGFILQQLIRRRTVTVSTLKENVLDVVEPYGFILAAPVIWHLGRTAHLLHLEDQKEIDIYADSFSRSCKVTPPTPLAGTDASRGWLYTSLRQIY